MGKQILIEFKVFNSNFEFFICLLKDDSDFNLPFRDNSNFSLLPSLLFF